MSKGKLPIEAVFVRPACDVGVTVTLTRRHVYHDARAFCKKKYRKSDLLFVVMARQFARRIPRIKKTMGDSGNSTSRRASKYTWLLHLCRLAQEFQTCQNLCNDTGVVVDK